MNKILVQNLVRIKPMIDNRAPVSYTQKRNRVLRQQRDFENSNFETLKNQTHFIVTRDANPRFVEYPSHPAMRTNMNKRATPPPEYAYTYESPLADWQTYQNEDEGWAFHMMQEQKMLE